MVVVDLQVNLRGWKLGSSPISQPGAASRFHEIFSGPCGAAHVTDVPNGGQWTEFVQVRYRGLELHSEGSLE